MACLVALALASCGRRGPLELPPGAPQQASTSTSPSSLQAQDRVLNDQDTPGLIQSPNTVLERSAEDKQQQVFSEGKVPRPINAPPAATPPPPAKTPFFLDSLL